MGSGGPKHKPKRQKQLQGTLRKDRDNPNAPEPSRSLPVAPATFNKTAQRWFEVLLERINKQGYASESHTEILAMAAMRLAEVEDLTERIRKAKSPVYRTKSTQGHWVYKSRPEVAMRNEAMRHAQSLLAELCLTPATVGKATARKDVSNKWGEFAK